MSLKIIRNLPRLSSIVFVRTINSSSRSTVSTKYQVSSLKYKFESRAFSSADDAKKYATYEEVKSLPKYPQKVLIDVREPDELKETGIIPTAINIPLNQVAEAMAPEFPADKFKKLYKRDKPSLDTEIIMHCKIGKRSQTAADLCAQLGYKNVKNYKGSWIEWSEKEGLNK